MPEIILDHAPHPLTDDGRRRRTVTIEAGATVEEIVAGELRSRPVDVEVLLDGRELDTLDIEPGPGAVIMARPRVRGGLGRLLGTIAVIAAAVFLPPVLGFAAGTVGAALVGAAITVVGGLIVNSLFPVDTPDIGGLPGAANNPAAAQLFGLSGGQNRARTYEPLPLVLGQHRMFPDLGALEYTENDGDDQFFHGIYHFGLGDLDISELRNGATLLSAFDGVQTEFSGSDGAIDLVAGNVDTTDGAALTDTSWVSRQTGAGTKRIGVDFGGRIFEQNDRGEYVSHTVRVQVRYSKPGTAAATRSWNLRHADSGVYRRSVNIDLPEAGDWTVEVRRTTAPSSNERIYDEVQFAALRSYQPDEGDYTGQTRLGVRIRASGQLSGRLDRLSALVKQKIPVPTNGAWGAARVVSSNPAALFRWYAKGVTVSGRTVAGVGLADDRIDHAGLARWYAWCQTKGYRCDLVIQGGMTHDAVLRLIARRGRATLSWKTGKLGVVYEDEAATPVGMISPANIIQGSFGIQWNSEPPADEVVVRYIEPDMDWGWNSVRRNRPGLVGTPQTTGTVTARGVIDKDNAAIECNLQAARQHYHRRRLTWEMSREGRNLHVGDVVWITHSLLDGGIAGRLAAASGAVAVLDRAPDGVTGGHVLLRLPDGSLHTSAVSGVSGREVTLASPPAAWPGAAQDTIYRLYDNTDPPRKARIVQVTPKSATRFAFAAIDEVAVYHTLATSDLTVLFPDARDRTPRVVSVVFAARRIQVGAGEMVELQASIATAGIWTGAVVRAGATAAELRTVDRLDGPADLIAKWIIPQGVGQHVEIIPGKDLDPDGPVWTGTWGLEAGAAADPPGDFAVQALTDGTRRFTFTPPVWPTYAGIRIRYHATAGTDFMDMTPLHDGLVTVSPYDNIDPAMGEWEFAAVSVTTEGVESDPVRVTATLGAMRDRGATWHFGNNDPPAELGQNGDFYYDKTDRSIWQKAAGAWTEQASVLGADGSTWLTGMSVPTAEQGADGDWYFLTGSEEHAGTIYRKVNGAWVELVDIDDGVDGATWHSGEGAPGAAIGAVGDWYFRTANGYVYQKTGAATWTFRRDITGPSGATWLFGTGDPDDADGSNGDLYLNTTSYEVFAKIGGSWNSQGSFAGADGAQWHTGSTAPAATLGSNGDWYFRTGSGTTAGSIYVKASGSWTKIVDIDQGADGSDGRTWHGGSGAPTGSLGIVGDWYYRTSNGYVYEKTASSTWTFRRDQTGPQGPRGAKGDKGDPATIGDAAITTAKIALSATADLFVSESGHTADVSTSVATPVVSVPGGAGFEYIAALACTIDNTPGGRTPGTTPNVALELLENNARVETIDSVIFGTAQNIITLVGYAARAITGTKSLRARVRKRGGSGNFEVYNATISVYLAKR